MKYIHKTSDIHAWVYLLEEVAQHYNNEKFLTLGFQLETKVHAVVRLPSQKS